jgi:hypothetical protein
VYKALLGPGAEREKGARLPVKKPPPGAGDMQGKERALAGRTFARLSCLLGIGWTRRERLQGFRRKTMQGTVLWWVRIALMAALFALIARFIWEEGREIFEYVKRMQESKAGTGNRW